MIDAHCHLDLYADPLNLIEECAVRQMRVLAVTTTPSAWEIGNDLATSYPDVVTALGLHPQLARQRRRELALFEDLLPRTRFVGEVGLDGQRESLPFWEEQLAVFESILGLCSEAGGKIISVHSRRASGEVLRTLGSFRVAGQVILHWFSGSVGEVDRAATLGCWFSVGPAMTSSVKGRSLLARMPRERILTETDGPFGGVKGSTVMPWQVSEVYGQLATVWGLSVEQTVRQVAQNYDQLLEG